MKSTLSVFIVVAVCAAYAVPVSDEVPATPYRRFIEFIDQHGIERTIDLEGQPDLTLLEQVSRRSGINSYSLYTRNNPYTGLYLVKDDVASIKQSTFNPNYDTVVLVHGWLQEEEVGMNFAIRDAYLARGNTNVIVLDWRALAVADYITAVRGVPEVGRELGRFLRFLKSSTGISLDSVHLVGFSLGAHVIASAGRELEGKVARVTGLDPAGPLWNLNSDKLGSDAAQYVEAIHTDGGLELSLGIGYSVADADFFPNGGNSQPGCLFSSICSHNRAWRFFAASVSYDHFEGTHCSSLLQLNLNTCRGDKLNMGNADLNKTGSGRYRLRTRILYPY